MTAAKEKCVKVCANHQDKFNKSVQKIREEGRFGRMFYGTTHVRWCRDEKYYAQARRRGTWKQESGALMNESVYPQHGSAAVEDGRRGRGGGRDDGPIEPSYIEAENLGIVPVRFKNRAYGIVEGTTDLYPKDLFHDGV